MQSLEEKATTVIYRQKRIPRSYSALEKEHRWHCTADDHSIVVDGMSPAEIMERAQMLMESAPEREDTEYRVVLVVTTKRGWVLG